MASSKPRKRVPLAPRVIFKLDTLAFPIALGMVRRRNNRFCVAYGTDIRDGLDYESACFNLGAAIMHALTCEGLTDK
jgi:hypothetical protein